MIKAKTTLLFISLRFLRKNIAMPSAMRIMPETCLERVVSEQPNVDIHRIRMQKNISQNEDQKEPSKESSDGDWVSYFNVKVAALKSETLPNSTAIILSLNAAMPQPIGVMNFFLEWT